MLLTVRCLAVTLVTTTALAAVPAAAVEAVHFELGGAHSASFDIARSPIPSTFTTGASFVVNNVRGVFEGVAGTRSLRFFNNALGGGFESIGDFVVNYVQVYRGPEATPFFLNGDYRLLDAVTGESSGLVIYGIPDIGGAVPEPASWALMIAGFGLIGVALRRRPTAAVTA